MPPDDERSNYGMAHEAFIRHVPIPDENVQRMRGEDERRGGGEGLRAAALAAAGPRRPSQADLPVLDFVLLGLGPDGHTASLFPHSPALGVEDRLVVVNEGEDTGKRLTVTYPVINAARRVVFIVSGAAKAGIVAEVLEGLRAPEAVPAQAVGPVRGSITWLLDEAAASELSSAVRP